jgi:hypothetical protein
MEMEVFFNLDGETGTALLTDEHPACHVAGNFQIPVVVLGSELVVHNLRLFNRLWTSVPFEDVSDLLAATTKYHGVYVEYDKEQ